MDYKEQVALLFSKRAERLELNRQAAILEQEEADLKRELLKQTKKSGVIGKYTVIVDIEQVPNVVSWPELIKYIKETGSVDLLQKRLTPRAVKDRLEEEGTIPGVTLIEKTNLTVEYNGQD